MVDEVGDDVDGMQVIAVHPPTGPSDFSFSSDSEDGAYSITVEGGFSYRIAGQIVKGTRYLSAEGFEGVTVDCGEDGAYDISARDGYFLDATLVGDSPLTAPAGQNVEVVLDYTIWNRAGCPDCSPRIIVGVDGAFGNILDVGPGAPYPGVSSRRTTFIQAPSEGGTLYAVLYAGSPTDDETNQAAREFYEDRWPDQIERRYIELGELEIEE